MKKSLLIGALSAAALLVGGTVAAFVVNDNAPAKTASVQIGKIVGDNTVTLSWKEGSAIDDVTDVAVGAAKKLGTVTVQATGKDLEGKAISSTNPFTGYLDLTLGSTFGGRLQAYVTESGKDAKINPSSVKDNRFTYEVEMEGEDKAFDVYVLLNWTTETVSNADILAVSEKATTLTVDWKGESEEFIQGYSYKIGDGEAVALVKNEEANLGENQVAEYKAEGVTMVGGEGITFYYDGTLITEIGPDGDGGNAYGVGEEIKFYNDATDNIYLKEWNDGFSYWIGGCEKAYYVVGSMTGTEPDYWGISEGFRLSPMGEEEKVDGHVQYQSGVLALKQGDKIKVAERKLKDWYGGDGDYYVNKDGNYRVYFVPEGNSSSDWAPNGGYFYVATVE